MNDVINMQMELGGVGEGSPPLDSDYGRRGRQRWMDIGYALEVEWIDIADGKGVRGEGKGKNLHDY